MRDLKYLFAYTVPLSAYISFESFGLGTYTAVLYAFVILPLLDVLTGKTATNLSAEQSQQNLRLDALRQSPYSVWVALCGFF